MRIQESLCGQIDVLLEEWRDLRQRSQYEDLSDHPDNDLVRFVTRARAAIHRIAGLHSVYAEQCEQIVKADSFPGSTAVLLAGVLESLRADIEAGYVQSLTELIHGEVFADFLEMAQHLLDQGYKDAAAVIAGSALEAHLRQLCDRSGVETEVDSRGQLAPKKADRMNSDLAADSIYSTVDQKNVTAWLGLRNKAAHGRYGDYEAAQVALHISGILDFITRNPA